MTKMQSMDLSSLTYLAKKYESLQNELLLVDGEMMKVVSGMKAMDDIDLLSKIIEVLPKCHTGCFLVERYVELKNK